MIKINDIEATTKIVDAESFEMIEDCYGKIEFQQELERYLNYRLPEVTGSSILIFQTVLVNLLK